MNSLLFSSLFFLSCGAMDSGTMSSPPASPGFAAPTTLPSPFRIKSTTLPKLIEQCHLSSEIVKKRDKVFLRVKLYYRNLKVMQNEYELDLNKLSKL